jgi:hypothetical protein
LKPFLSIFFSSSLCCKPAQYKTTMFLRCRLGDALASSAGGAQALWLPCRRRVWRLLAPPWHRHGTEGVAWKFGRQKRERVQKRGKRSRARGKRKSKGMPARGGKKKSCRLHLRLRLPHDARLCTGWPRCAAAARARLPLLRARPPCCSPSAACTPSRVWRLREEAHGVDLRGKQRWI